MNEIHSSNRSVAEILSRCGFLCISCFFMYFYVFTLCLFGFLFFQPPTGIIWRRYLRAVLKQFKLFTHSGGKYKQVTSFRKEKALKRVLKTVMSWNQKGMDEKLSDLSFKDIFVAFQCMTIWDEIKIRNQVCNMNNANSINTNHSH